MIIKFYTDHYEYYNTASHLLELDMDTSLDIAIRGIRECFGTDCTIIARCEPTEQFPVRTNYFNMNELYEAQENQDSTISQALGFLPSPSTTVVGEAQEAITRDIESGLDASLILG